MTPDSNLPKWPRNVVLLVAPCTALLVGFFALPRAESAVRASERAAERVGDLVTTEKPDVSISHDIELGQALRVIGADLPTQAVRRGEKLQISTFFQVLKSLDRDWKIFCHIDKRGASHRIHGDHPPVASGFPTSLWRPNQFVEDRFVKGIDASTPPGEYDVFVGLYIGDERLEFSGGDRSRHGSDNRVRLGRIKIE